MIERGENNRDFITCRNGTVTNGPPKTATLYGVNGDTNREFATFDICHQDMDGILQVVKTQCKTTGTKTITVENWLQKEKKTYLRNGFKPGTKGLDTLVCHLESETEKPKQSKSFSSVLSSSSDSDSTDSGSSKSSSSDSVGWRANKTNKNKNLTNLSEGSEPLPVSTPTYVPSLVPAPVTGPGPTVPVPRPPSRSPSDSGPALSTVFVPVPSPRVPPIYVPVPIIHMYLHL